MFDGDRAPQTGAEVRNYHIGIKGVDDQGRRYNALNPDVFYWAHSTFFMGTILTAERFGDGLTEAQKRQLFDEHITWYRMYGMSMRPVPKTWEDFRSTGITCAATCWRTTTPRVGCSTSRRCPNIRRCNGFRTGCGVYS